MEEQCRKRLAQRFSLSLSLSLSLVAVVMTAGVVGASGVDFVVDSKPPVPEDWQKSGRTIEAAGGEMLGAPSIESHDFAETVRSLLPASMDLKIIGPPDSSELTANGVAAGNSVTWELEGGSQLQVVMQPAAIYQKPWMDHPTISLEEVAPGGDGVLAELAPGVEAIVRDNGNALQVVVLDGRSMVNLIYVGNDVTLEEVAPTLLALLEWPKPTTP
jgi:hypothetical protein